MSKMKLRFKVCQIKIVKIGNGLGMTHNDRVLLSGREFEKLLLSNAGHALLAAILLLNAVAGYRTIFKQLNIKR